jgi:hypothetical protein
MSLTPEQLNEVSRVNIECYYDEIFNIIKSGQWTQEMFIEYMLLHTNEEYGKGFEAGLDSAYITNQQS